MTYTCTYEQHYKSSSIVSRVHFRAKYRNTLSECEILIKLSDSKVYLRGLGLGLYRIQSVKVLDEADNVVLMSTH